MEKRKQPKRNYGSPQSWPTEVAFERALLVATARFLFTVEETENMNAEAGSDEPGGEMYFEF